MKEYCWARLGWLVAALVSAPLGCGASGPFEKPFTARWQNDRGRSISLVQERLAGSKTPAGQPLAVGVGAGSLIALPLDGNGVAWSQAATLDALPAIAGDVVVATAAGRLLAFEARTGKPLWNVDAEGRRLRGAGDDGATTAVTLGSREDGQPSQLLLVDRAGHVRHRLDSAAELGRPAVLAGVALVPWQNQYVSAIDVESGEEIGRLLMREQVSNALAIGGFVFVGQLGLLRFDDRIAAATTGGARRIDLPFKKLPGDPVWLSDGTKTELPTAGARARVRLLARPVERGEELELATGHFAATYYRVVMGFRAEGAKLAWVKTLPADSLGGGAASPGFVLCDKLGGVHRIDATSGAAQAPLSLGARVRACVVQAGDLSVAANAPAPSLTEQVSAAILLHDPEMAAAHEFLLSEIGVLADPAVTPLLIDVLSAPRTSPRLRVVAERLLAARRDGVDAMLAALQSHYDYLTDTLRTPPVGALAEALAAMKEHRAAPLLAEHLNDPANPAEDLVRIAKALTVLATVEQLDELLAFLALYRATADEEALVEAVLLVGKALLALQNDAAREAVENAARGPLTVPAVRRGLAELLEVRPAREPGAAASSAAP
jgi:outer membrane protein assembly factor BamB